MTTEQQRNMLEASAKACGLVFGTGVGEYSWFNGQYGYGIHRRNANGTSTKWNPRTNPADTAEMCAELGIDWINSVDSVISVSAEYDCEAFLKDHDNSRLKAWMYAATMVAAKIGGFEE